MLLACLLYTSEFVIGDYIKMGDYHGGFIKVNQAFGISATTEHPAEAAALIQFLVAEEDGVKTLGDTRGVPANKACLLYTSQRASG